ncbi:MAG: aspartate aminotransferase family protein [Anaerolineae bacterium]
MLPRDHTRLLMNLNREYAERFPRSQAAHAQALDVLVDGGSHGARLYDPYPVRMAAAGGAYFTDLDGHRILDFWQGHYANILGHNPPLIREALAAALQAGDGLQTGIPDEREVAFSQLLAQATGAEAVRLTTAGTLATMYAIMLARGFTGRKLVVKLSGGWHGANPMALKGVGRGTTGFDHVDSAGVSSSVSEEIVVAPYNDVETLRKVFRSLGDRIACLIFEPCMGAAGFVPTSRAYMDTARALTTQYGALLILDEVITGFRYCAGGVQRLYGIQADLSTYGKIIGGGMPVSAVVGRADVLATASRKARERVWFNGGTFCAHPLSLLAGQRMLEHLMAHEDTIYPALASLGERLRAGVEEVFAAHGILAHCTGRGNDALAGGSLATVCFPLQEGFQPTSAEHLTDPALCDVALLDRVFKLGMLLNGVNVAHGLGAISTAHGDEELARLFEACDVFARRVVATA